MNRRNFIRGSLSAVLVAQGCRFNPAGSPSTGTSIHLPGTTVAGAVPRVPEKLRAPFGWRVLAVPGKEATPLQFSWPGLSRRPVPIRFRVAAALDERGAQRLEAFLPRSNETLGILDIRFASQFQVFEIELEAALAGRIPEEGLALRRVDGDAFEILDGDDVPEALRPHLLLPPEEPALDGFYKLFGSMATIQQFGWMEGCVLDGLLDLSRDPRHAWMRQVARDHLDLFCKGDRLVYEDPRSKPADGVIYGIEGTLPFAALAQLQPQSPLFDLALDFWNAHLDPSGSIQDRNDMTSEGAYTVGYAMAELARVRRSPELMELALNQSRLRQQFLFHDGAFWRTCKNWTRRTNRNWCRGIAWQILGMARTMAAAQDMIEISDMVPVLQEFARWIQRYQRGDGLWSVFVDEPDLVQDTAGSAGIAAALAIGHANSWLDESSSRSALLARTGLENFLTPDGFLGGVSQSNKGGEGLQRSDYRAIYQMAMGLYAQLLAATRHS